MLMEVITMTMAGMNSDKCDIENREKIQSRAYKLRKQSPYYHEEQYYLDLANHQIRKEQAIADNSKWYKLRKWIISGNRCDIKDRKKIQLRICKLRQQSSDYHEEQYYLDLANHQIKIEHAIVDNYKWYDPRKWIGSIEYKCLKKLAHQLSKCSVLNILEQLAALSVLFGVINFVSEAKQRHDELIANKMENLLEVIRLDEQAKVQSAQIVTYLQSLNSRDIDFSKFLDFGAYKSFFNILNWEKIYITNKETSDDDIKRCKQILKIPLLLPRWESADFVNLKMPKELNLSGVELCNASLRQAILEETILEHALLANANLKEAKLMKANLKNSDLRESSLVLADLTGADLTGADLTGADLKNANLTCNEITIQEKSGPKKETRCTNLTSANLTDANLDLANLKDANLKDANLEGAELNEIEVNNLIKSQLKLACNWDKANYIFRQTEDEKWEVDTQANQKYIEDIRNDKASNPQTSVDRCSQWN